MKIRSVTLFVFIFFLLSVFTFAVPPVQTTISGENILTIQYPLIDYYKINEDIVLNFHVYNSTDYIRTNSTTNCTIHLYDFNGVHLLNEKLNYDVSDEDFYININKNNLTNIGVYSFLVYCEDTQAGFVSSIFEITPNGQNYENNIKYSVITFICFIFAFAIIMMFLAWFFVKPMWLRWCFLGSLGFIPLLFSTLMSNLLTTRITFISLKSLQVMLTWIGWITFILIFVVALLYFIKWTDKASKKKYGG